MNHDAPERQYAWAKVRHRDGHVGVYPLSEHRGTLYEGDFVELDHRGAVTYDGGRTLGVIAGWVGMPVPIEWLIEYDTTYGYLRGLK